MHLWSDVDGAAYQRTGCVERFRAVQRARVMTDENIDVVSEMLDKGAERRSLQRDDEARADDSAGNLPSITGSGGICHRKHQDIGLKLGCRT